MDQGNAKPLCLAFAILVSLITYISCTRSNEVTMETLLTEMVDRSSMATLPDPYYSNFRREYTGDESDSMRFIGVDVIDGRKERILFDQSGSGAVMHIGVTASDENVIFRVYINNNDTPEIEGSLYSIVGGNALCDAPLSSSKEDVYGNSKYERNLYLPIPYSSHCKITCEESDAANLYYAIDYRKYDDTHIKEFRASDMKAYAEMVNTACIKLMNNHPTEADCPRSLSKVKILKQNEKCSSAFNNGGAIRNITLKLKSDNMVEALHSTVLQVECDGKTMVWSPVNKFYDIDEDMRFYKSYYSAFTPDFAMANYRVMPYKDNCVVSVINYGKCEIEAALVVSASDWLWNDNSMYFCAGVSVDNNHNHVVKPEIDAVVYGKALSPVSWYYLPNANDKDNIKRIIVLNK